MIERVLDYLFGAASFMPHGYCLLWRPDLVAMHAAADLAITLAYFSIPAAIVVFLRRRKLPFNGLAWMFAAFIMLCGMTHLVGLVTLWIPAYGFQALIKIATAIVSVATAVVIWRLFPQLLKIPTEKELIAVNTELRAEIERRTAAEWELKKAQVLLEDRVARRTKALQNANEDLQQFAYLVSHDLRSPLVNIMGFTSEIEESNNSLRELLCDRDSEPDETERRKIEHLIKEDVPEALDFIRASVSRMDDLTKSILQFSRAGRRTLQSEPVDLNNLLNKIVKSLTKLAERREADVVVQPLPEVVSDRLAIEQVMTNLIENALKYLSPDRKGRVEVRAIAGDDGQITIEIEDNGRGIAGSDRDRIFHMFRRAGDVREPGEGMGLAYVKAIVQRLRGRIDFESEPGKGTVFKVTIPTRMEASA